jgi:hypothetical protein
MLEGEVWKSEFEDSYGGCGRAGTQWVVIEPCSSFAMD